MTDLSTIKAGERKIEILHPGTGAPLGLRVGIFSIDDERMMKIKRSITDRRNYLEQRGKTFTAVEVEENKANVLFAGMTDWEWYNPTGKEGDKGFDPDAAPTWQGSIPDFNRRNVVGMLSDPAIPWFSDQISAEMSETKSFFNNSNSH